MRDIIKAIHTVEHTVQRNRRHGTQPELQCLKMTEFSNQRFEKVGNQRRYITKTADKDGQRILYDGPCKSAFELTA